MSRTRSSSRQIFISTFLLVACMLLRCASFQHSRRTADCGRRLWKRFAQQPQNLCSGPTGTTGNIPSGTVGNIARTDKSAFVKSSNTLIKTIVVGSTLLQSFSGAAIADTVSVYDKPGSKEVRKRPLDERLYRSLELGNSMRVLLVSDPSSSRSAAALDVNVGAFSDPREVPGLAHFCEHMSFLGTERYPKEEEFSSYLSSHGGSSNAYTDSEDTVYYFDVNAEFTEEALDRFSQFFISPLFTQSATSRELNAIDSEHAKNINSDSFRLYQLEKDGANPAHPLSKFATGNKATLETETIKQGIDVRQQLLEFHSKRYSSNRMTLCISGRQDLNQLEAWTKKYFSDIPNKKATNPADEYWGKIPPFLPQKEASILEVVPVGESRRLSLCWPIWVKNQAERDVLLRAKPEQIVAHLIGHEGKGSVRSLLVEKGWGNSVQAAVTNDVSDMQMFEVSIDLTEEGFKHKDDVADVIFSYIHLLNTPSKENEGSRNGIPPYVYSEVTKLSAIAFNYAEKSDPASSVSRLVADMQDFTDPTEYVTGPRLYEHSNPSAVQSYLDHLTPQDVRLKLISSEFKGKTTQEGKYYGSQYNRKSLSAQTKKWSQTVATGGAYTSQLAVPKPNELIPDRFDLVGKPPANSAERVVLTAAPPTKLREDSRFTLWHKVDRSFNQPKVFAITTLAVPTSFYDTSFVVRSKLFSACFMDSMTEFLYDARLADMGFEIEFTSKGVQLILSGFSDKLAPFTEKVFQALKDYEPDAATFNRFKDLTEREFKSWKSQQPYYHCSYYASLASETLQFEIADVQKALAQTTQKDLSNFLSGMLGSSHGTAIVIGNIDEKGSRDIIDIVEKTFPFTPLAQDLRSRRRPVEIPVSALSLAGLSPENAATSTLASGKRLSRPGPNVKDDNSATTFYFQLPTRKIEDYVMLEILAESLEQAFYNSLRTQQQLGYIVYSGVRSREGIYSLTLTVQSALVDGAELSRRIEAFVESAILTAEAITQEELESFQEGLAVRKLEPDQRLTSQASRFWGEIVEHEDEEEPIFDRHIKEVKAIRAVTTKQFGQFTRDFLSAAGSKRRLLVSQVTSTKSPAVAAAPVDANLSVPVYLDEIGGEVAFRNTCPQL